MIQLTSLHNSLKWGLLAILMALLTIVAFGQGKPNAPKTNADEAYARARVAVNHQQYAVARNLYQICLKHDPARAIAWRDLGACYLKLEDPNSAFETLKQAVKLDEKDPQSHDLLAVSAEQLGKENLALKHSRQALDLAPHNVDILANHGALLTRLDKDQQAVTVYTHALELAPDHQGALAGYGSLLCKMGYYQEAIAPLERVTYAQGQQLPAQYNLALAYYRTHHYQEAMQQAGNIIQQKKDHANAYQLRGQCYFELRNAEAACRDFHMARQLGNKDAVAYYKLNCLGHQP